MSLDINELVRAVKQAAVDAVKADGPMAVSFGTVTSASPLKIQVKRSSSSPVMAGKNTLSWTDGRHLDGNATDNWRKP